MKKFKHKKTGIIGSVGEDGWLHFERCNGNTCSSESISMELIEDSLDWEEIIQKDYEILRFSDGFNEYYKSTYGHFTINNTCFYSEKFLLDKRECKIISVKRLSDGVIFTVGNTVICNKKYIERIKNIDFYQKEHLIFNFDNTSNNFTTESEWDRMQLIIELPLFTTEDGVEVYEGNEVHWVLTTNLKYLYKWKVGNSHRSILESGDYKIFYDEEKAKEFVELNILKYSLNDMVKIASHWAYIKNITPEKVLKIINKNG